MKFKLITEDDDGKIVEDIELSKFEFGQALIMHKRFSQRKTR